MANIELKAGITRTAANVKKLSEVVKTITETSPNIEDTSLRDLEEAANLLGGN